MMDGAGGGGFVRQIKRDHTLGASIAISILPLDGRLEGLSIWWKEELDERASGWLRAITLQCAGPWTVRWL